MMRGIPVNIRSTTIVAVRRDGKVAMAGDGQVTLGEKTVIKHGATKVRTLSDGQILAGFAGSAADAVTLFDMFERKLKDHSSQLVRAAVEMGKGVADRSLPAQTGSAALGGRSTDYPCYFRFRRHY